MELAFCLVSRFLIGLISMAIVASAAAGIVGVFFWLAEKFSIVKVICVGIFGLLVLTMLAVSFYEMGVSIIGRCQ